MATQPPTSREPGGNKRVLVVMGIVGLCVVAALVGGWTYLRFSGHNVAGLEGVWIDDSGQDVSYQFREDGEFLIRQKLPGNLAPFSGDPGVEHRPWGKWSRNGQSISVQTVRNWGFDLVLGEDGLLRGERVVDQWSGQGEHSRTKTPLVLKRKPGTP
jgi:hypothetical protein